MHAVLFDLRHFTLLNCFLYNIFLSRERLNAIESSPNLDKENATILDSESKNIVLNFFKALDKFFHGLILRQPIAFIRVISFGFYRVLSVDTLHA